MNNLKDKSSDLLKEPQRANVVATPLVTEVGHWALTFPGTTEQVVYVAPFFTLLLYFFILIIMYTLMILTSVHEPGIQLPLEVVHAPRL